MSRFNLDEGLLIEPLDLREQGSGIDGESAAIRALLEQIEDAAYCSSNVLIIGERGTGKGLVAREIHRRSERRLKPFVDLNSATVPEALFESELFGHEKGAFTGAGQRKVGRFELAEGGTLFLDEVAEFPLSAQAKLLRVLEDGGFERLGGLTTLLPDTRVIAATNQDLNAMVNQGRFRADLLDRLGGVFKILTPPLREHREDLRALIPAALAKAVSRAGLGGQVYMEASAASLLCNWEYPWPGNVRQFEQFIERLAIGAKRRHGDVISRELLCWHMTEIGRASERHDDNRAKGESIQDQELIERALQLANGNKAQAARDLGWTRNQLRYRYDERRSRG
jgi:two-component system, NtrC family, nitrogen regulation response regulator GlnG